jgi:hypothetical protein
MHQVRLHLRTVEVLYYSYLSLDEELENETINLYKQTTEMMPAGET